MIAGLLLLASLLCSSAFHVPYGIEIQRLGMKNGFSYVEGEEYGDVMEELDAMGGDPSFLDDSFQFPLPEPFPDEETKTTNVEVENCSSDLEEKPWVWGEFVVRNLSHGLQCWSYYYYVDRWRSRRRRLFRLNKNVSLRRCVVNSSSKAKGEAKAKSLAFSFKYQNGLRLRFFSTECVLYHL